MTNYALIQQRIDTGLGKAALRVGPPFNVFRCDANAAGDFPAGWTQVGTNVPWKRSRIGEKNLETNLLSGATIWLNLVGDASQFLLGDVFTSSDAPFVSGISYGAGATILPGTIELDAFCLVWHPPVSKPVGARIDRRCQIFRAQTGAVPETAADATPTWNAMKAGSMPLVLTGGVFAFGSPSEAASFVPVGIGSTERPSRAPEFGPQALTTTTPTSRYFAYIPPLPGYVPLESDVIVLEDGTQFTVTQPYAQQAGVVGSQLTIDRTVMAG